MKKRTNSYRTIVASIALLLSFTGASGALAQHIYTYNDSAFGIHRYDAISGAISGGFVPSGFPSPNSRDLAVAGSTLYELDGVGSTSGFVVKTYDANTGAETNSSLFGAFGTTNPGTSSTAAFALSANRLFTAVATFTFFTQFGGATIAAYDAITGAVVNSNLISLTGTSSTNAYLSSEGNSLFVAYDGKLGSYNQSTGVAVNADLITGLRSTSVGPSPGQYASTSPAALTVQDGKIYLAMYSEAWDGPTLISKSSTIQTYDAATGASINSNLLTLAGSRVYDIGILGGTLFIDADAPGGASRVIGSYDSATGSAISPSLISGAGSSFAVVPEPATAGLLISGLAIAMAGRRRGSRIQNDVGQSGGSIGERGRRSPGGQ